LKKSLKKYAPNFILEEPYWYLSSNKKKIDSLKNKYEGKRCFILGNGPSLNKNDLTKLEGEYSFGVNGIFYKTEESGYKPTFYVVEDTQVMNDNLEKIDRYDVEYKFLRKEYKSKIINHNKVLYFNMNRGFYERSSPHFASPRFSLDCSERLYCGQTVTFLNLQIAYYLGFKQVVLIGMDFEYNIPPSAIIDGDVITSTQDDTNHFHPDYFGKGKKWHDPKLDNVIKSYLMAKDIYESDGREILNATVGGRLEVFDRADYEGLFR
jgi:hypothetical protein